MTGRWTVGAALGADHPARRTAGGAGRYFTRPLSTTPIVFAGHGHHSPELSLSAADAAYLERRDGLPAAGSRWGGVPVRLADHARIASGTVRWNARRAIGSESAGRRALNVRPERRRAGQPADAALFAQGSVTRPPPIVSRR